MHGNGCLTPKRNGSPKQNMGPCNARVGKVGYRSNQGIDIILIIANVDCTRETTSPHRKKMIKMPGTRELIDSMAIMYGGRKGGDSFWVCKHGSDSGNTVDCPPTDLEISIDSTSIDRESGPDTHSLIDPEEATRIVEDRKTLLSGEIPLGHIAPPFPDNMALEMAQSADVASGGASQSSRPDAYNPYRNRRVYNPYRQNLDRYRTGGVNNDSNQTRPPHLLKQSKFRQRRRQTRGWRLPPPWRLRKPRWQRGERTKSRWGSSGYRRDIFAVFVPISPGVCVGDPRKNLKAPQGEFLEAQRLLLRGHLPKMRRAR